MPYINKARRLDIEFTHQAETAGELNYLLTLTCLDYVQRHGKTYEHLSEAVSALECAKLELYRRLVAPYEDQKIQENGDLHGYEQMGGGA